MCHSLEMNTQTKITKFYADAKICEVMRAYLKTNNLDNICDICEVKGVGDVIILRGTNQEKVYTVPIRLGYILDQIYYYNHINNNSLIYFSGGVLDIDQGVFANKEGKQIYLTEKEVEILSFLHENKDIVIPREEFLKAVWGYAKNIETHTLETHIYRLRQKIELDSANPEILLTMDEGYKINT